MGKPSAKKDRKLSEGLLNRMGDAELYRVAYSENKTLSRWLEEQDPSEDYADGSDAFQRLIQAAGIVVRSDHAAGYYADKFEEFDKTTQTRSLVPEFINRQWRSVANGGEATTRALYSSDDYGLNTIMNQYTNAPGVRGQQLLPAIPLSEIVAVTTPIDTDSYRAFYLRDSDSTAEQLRMVRIAEGTEVPRSKLVGGENSIRLKKYGRGLEVSYETLRRQRIDMVSLHIQRMAVQAEKDRVGAALDVMVNGDGNANTAGTVYNMSDLDSQATPGTLTLKAWAAFRMKFLNPYYPTTVLAQDDVMLQLFLLNSGSGNLPLVTIPAGTNFSLTPINPGLADGLRAGWTADAPADKIVAFDRRFAIERVIEIGSDISEIERWATRQVEVLVMTQNDAFASLDSGSVKILDLAS